MKLPLGSFFCWSAHVIQIGQTLKVDRTATVIQIGPIFKIGPISVTELIVRHDDQGGS